MSDICYPDGTDWTCVYNAEQIAALDPVVKERSEALAWLTLAALTGNRVSLCPVLIRPCLAGCNRHTWDTAPVGGPSGYFSPYLSGGSWYNGCGCSTGDCSCTALCEVVLPTAVGGIESVFLNGATLDPTAYRVDNGNRLLRTDGECWPSCQNMTGAETADGTFGVFYYPGVAPNDVLRYAAGVLANEFYLACGGRDCRLPSGVTSITRAGMTMEIPTAAFSDGSTGIPEVDAVIRIYNPHGLKARPRVLSPDRSRGRLQTWGA